MAIQKRFIHFKKFSDFNSKKLSANEANTQYTIGVSGEIQTGAPDILYQSYCWIKDTKQQWTHGQLYSGGENSIYVTEFTLDDCDAAIANGGEIQMNSHSIWDAVAANKIIFIPRGDFDGGCVALSSISDDYVYLTCVDNFHSVVYHIDVSPDDIAVVDRSPWRFQLTTINGKLLFGNGDIELAPIETFEDRKYVKVVGISDGTWLYALPTSANGDEDDVIATRSTLKTINGQSLFGSGDITTPTFLRIGDADDEAKANFIAVANGEKSADYYICSSKVQGAPADGIVTILELAGPTGSPVYVSYTFYGSPMKGSLANKLLKITTTLTVSTGAITTTYEAVLDAKQDTIDDLDDIREGAAKGATAVQPEDISEFITIEDVAEVAKTGSYNDLVDTPTIKDEVYIADFTMESLMNGMNNSHQVGCDMQALVAAMNANKIILVRENVDSSYKGAYVLNGYAEDLLYFSIVLHQGDVLYCEGTDYSNEQLYIDGRTLHVQSWADKQDILKSGENIKTINGESILGSGNIATNVREYKITKSEGQTVNLIEGYKWMVTNLLNYRLVIIMPSKPTSDDYTKECGITFTTGTGAPTIIFSGNIWWVNGTAPTIDANCVYEFSFKFNFANNMWLGVYASFKTV